MDGHSTFPLDFYHLHNNKGEDKDKGGVLYVAGFQTSTTIRIRGNSLGKQKQSRAHEADQQRRTLTFMTRVAAWIRSDSLLFCFQVFNPSPNLVIYSVHPVSIISTSHFRNIKMGWFSSSPEATPAPKEKEAEQPTSLGGTYTPMKRNERQKCWEARDIYFQCLDRNNILDSIKEAGLAEDKCGKESKLFEQDCAASWVCN